MTVEERVTFVMVQPMKEADAPLMMKRGEPRVTEVPSGGAIDNCSRMSVPAEAERKGTGIESDN